MVSNEQKTVKGLNIKYEELLCQICSSFLYFDTDTKKILMEIPTSLSMIYMLPDSQSKVNDDI